MSVVENDLHFTHIDAIDIFRKILMLLPLPLVH